MNANNDNSALFTMSLEERVRRKRRRNRLLILFSPLLILLSPILLPIFFYVRKKKKNKGKSSLAKSMPRLGDVAGSLDQLPLDALDTSDEERVSEMADTFALCRVIGNDLVPRHKAGQSIENVSFILENEPEFENCTKLWILNRIFDPENEEKLIALLDRHNQIYERIPFDPVEYQKIGYDFSTFDSPMVFSDGTLVRLDQELTSKALTQVCRERNNYVMNNNGARNEALELCLRHAKWALPFDGNCYFTSSAWEAFRQDVISQRDKRYFTVPMARMQDNADLLRDDKPPQATEEPQMAFRFDAPLRFDTAHPYGRRPKVELFLHLGIPGPWQKWPLEPFDCPPRKVSPEGHRVGQAGWVARLFSGQAKLEKDNQKSFINRGLARADAIRATLNMLEARQMQDKLTTGDLLFYNTQQIENLAGAHDNPDRNAVITAADEALTRGPFSVTDKPEPGPSGDPHDYFHPVPYWWPNPKKKNGLPYVFRDGQRVPGTRLYEAESDRYDRTRLQRMFDDTTALAIAARISGKNAYSDHAERLVRTWFLDPKTRMSPNLTYAQVRRGHRGNKGLPHGLIETKDFYFFLDAVRLLGNDDLTDGLRKWCAEFFDWMKTSDQGGEESHAANNHGTCFDLQAASMAAFLEDIDALQAINLRAQARLLGSINEDGQQPHELQRSLTQHYCAFNIQSWINLFQVLEGVGMRPWNSDAAERLIAAMRRTLEESVAGWSHAQIEPFDTERLVPINHVLRLRTGQSIWPTDTNQQCFYPHDGIPPFWRQAFVERPS